MTAEMSKVQRGRGKFLYIYYLNIQDCAEGLGHKVLMRGAAFGKGDCSVCETQSYHADREGETYSGCHGSKSLRVLWAQTGLLRNENINMPPRLITKDIAREPLRSLAICWDWLFSLWMYFAEPSWCFCFGLVWVFCGGGGHAMTWGCLQLLLADSGNLSGEKFLQRFCRLAPEKVFHEGYSCSLCSDSYIPCMCLRFCSVLFLFNIFDSHTQQHERWRRQRRRCG